MVPVVVLSKACPLFIMFIIGLHLSAHETTIHQLAEQEDTTEKSFQYCWCNNPFLLIIHAMIQSMKIQWKPVWIITYNYYNSTLILSKSVSVPYVAAKNGFPSFGDIELDKKSGLPFKLGLFYVVVFWWPFMATLYYFISAVWSPFRIWPLWMRRSKYHFLLCHPAMNSQQCGWTGLLNK